MSEEESLKEILVSEPTEILMFKDYLRHMKMEDIASKYEMSEKNVYHIAKNNNWKNKRKKAKELAYKRLEKIYKEQVVDIVKFIQHDVNTLITRCITEKREMTKEERQYVLSLFEKYTKETKLVDGKPTEITDGNHKIIHEVILPAGVTRYGVIPPDPSVIQVESIPKLPEEKNDEFDEELFD